MKPMMIHLRAFAFLMAVALVSVSAVASGLGVVKNFKDKGGTVTLNCSHGELLITPMTDGIVRVAALPAGCKAKIAPSATVVLKSVAKHSVADAGSQIAIKIGGGLEVNVDKATSAITYSVGGVKMLAEADGIDNSGNEKTATFRSDADEAFYGCGERGISYNLRGDSLIMFNKQNYGYGHEARTAQMNITVPLYISSKGYGVLFDDYTASKLILQNPVKYVTNTRKALAYYFISSSDRNIAGVVKNYTLLTGRQDLAPFWSLGYITSKYGYHTQKETLGVIDTLRRENYPVDAIVLDLYWYGKETDMGRFEWNTQQWPDHKKMLADLRADGVKTIIISQPYINKIGAIDNYNMMAKAGLLATDSVGRVHDVHTWVGDAGMLDVSNPKTREWLWNRYKLLTDEGVSGWWGDLGEPEVHPLTVRHNNGETASEYHNIYGNVWSQIIYDGFRKDYPNTRLMTLMRGGTAGLQRFSVFPWSTDVGRSWGGLQSQVPIMLNSALSGMGYMSSDVGGFAVDPKNPVDAELYVRWLEMGQFIPVLRTHSTVWAEPYHYTAAGYQNLFHKIISDRYAWLPYNYTLAYENATTGAPFVRPLNFYDASDKVANNCVDEYMWGDNVLVAPVLEQGAIVRDVYFPKGTWIDMNNPAKTYVGPRTVTYRTPLDILPHFARAGSFIVKNSGTMKSTEDFDDSRLDVVYYHGNGSGKYTLFDDDRTSTNTIANGQFQLIHFTSDESNGSLRMNVKAEGSFKGMPAKRNLVFTIPASVNPKSVKINGEKVDILNESNKNTKAYVFLPSDSSLWIAVDWNYAPIEITVEN
jgi:oligosaccharide 4-alpha-D-glucosyltransferase